MFNKRLLYCIVSTCFFAEILQSESSFKTYLKVARQSICLHRHMWNYVSEILDYLSDRTRCSRRGCGSCFPPGHILCSRTADSHHWSCQSTTEHFARTRRRPPETRNSRPAYTTSFFFSSSSTTPRPAVRNFAHMPGNSRPGWRSCCRFLGNHQKWTAGIPQVPCPSDILESPQSTVPGPEERSRCLKDKQSGYWTRNNGG